MCQIFNIENIINIYYFNNNLLYRKLIINGNDFKLSFIQSISKYYIETNENSFFYKINNNINESKSSISKKCLEKINENESDI